MMKPPEPVTVFLVYASEDESLCIELERHLSVLVRKGSIFLPQRREIVASLLKEIEDHLEQAPIILLLISANFLDSDDCYNIGRRAIQQHKVQKARVIPIIVSSCVWEKTPFFELKPLPRDGKPVITWPDRDVAWKDVVDGICRALNELSLLAVNTPRATWPLVWDVPYSQNRFFTGRDDQLLDLHTQFQKGLLTALSQPQAITGLGGIGKTQIALEYAYRFRLDYQVVLWVPADTREKLTSRYLTIAALLNLPEKDKQDSAHVITAVKNWLQRNTYLLILDNADELELIDDFLPPSVSGHVLLTTRTQTTGRFARQEVDILPIELGALFLLRRAHLLASDAPLDQAQMTEQNAARAICEELGGLPLALDQAGAYIDEEVCGLTEYQLLLQQRRADLLKHRGKFAGDHPDSVVVTLSLSFQSVEQKDPAAADLLRLCAFLAPDAIPKTLLTQGAKYLDPPFASISADAHRLNQAIGELRAYSLLSRETTSNADPQLSIHRLVQAVIKDAMDASTYQQWAERAVKAVSEAFPIVEFETWERCKLLLPHAKKLIKEYEEKFPEAVVGLLNQAGIYLKEQGQYDEAEHSLKSALEIRKKLGEKLENIALGLSHLADLYYEKGEYSKAQNYEKGEYSKAQKYYQAALDIDEEMLGPLHETIAIDLTNLAQCLCKQGNYTKAKKLFDRALKIYKHFPGHHLNHYAIVLDNLAGLYLSKGNEKQAENSYIEALKINKTADSLNNLAQLYGIQRRYKEAEECCKSAYDLEDKRHGKRGSPNMATTCHILAIIYSALGRHREAEDYFWQAFRMRKKLHGADHSEVKKVVTSIRHYYVVLGKDKEEVEKKLNDEEG